MWGNLDQSVQNTSGGFLDNTQGSASGGDKARRGQNIVPVMIKHLTRCTSDLMLWGEPVHTVTFTGIVRHIEQATTKTSFEIEDETGTITAFRWLEAERNANQCQFELNTYVRVYGHLREQSGKKHILILRISPLTDLNELTNHLLEVTHTMLKAANMKKAKEAKNLSTNTDSNSIDVDMPNDNCFGLRKEHTIVYKIIHAYQSADGIERSVLKSRVPENILPHVDDIVDFLTSEGHIYTTITNDNFKAN